MSNRINKTFVLQTKLHRFEDEDVFVVKKLIDNQADKYRYSEYSYLTLDYSEIEEVNSIPISIGQELTPIGSLQFVSKWLSVYQKCDRMPPIEVPACLRTSEFLQREYDFYTKENLPRENYYFIKNVDQLKSFSYLGNLSLLDFDSIPDGMYMASNYIPIVAEYRMFVSKNHIKAIQFYEGDCTIFPDVSTIQKMANVYYLSKNSLYSYTLDIGVTSSNKTIILEIHPVTSVGLYGYANKDLLNMYIDGYNWYINHQDYYCYKE